MTQDMTEDPIAVLRRVPYVRMHDHAINYLWDVQRAGRDAEYLASLGGLLRELLQVVSGRAVSPTPEIAEVAADVVRWCLRHGYVTPLPVPGSSALDEPALDIDSNRSMYKMS